jgi:hypothetical protein
MGMFKKRSAVEVIESEIANLRSRRATLAARLAEAHRELDPGARPTKALTDPNPAKTRSAQWGPRSSAYGRT